GKSYSAIAVVLQQLERRSLLSITLHSGVLRVVGTDGPDVIAISLDATDATKVNVENDGAVRTFNADAVRTIRVSAGAGDDDVSIDLKHRSTVYGGEGDDAITGGSHVDHI